MNVLFLSSHPFLSIEEDANEILYSVAFPFVLSHRRTRCFLILSANIRMCRRVIFLSFSDRCHHLCWRRLTLWQFLVCSLKTQWKKVAWRAQFFSTFYLIWVCKLVFMRMKVCYIDPTDGQMAYFRECVRCEMMRSTHLDRMQVC